MVQWPWSKREQFSSWTLSDSQAFAAWLRGEDDGSGEIISANTVLGISAVLRAVSIISTTIAGLPLRTYERQGDERVRIDSVFDDPFPGIDGMTPFAWVETTLIHLLLWRKAFLWHEAIDPRTGDPSVYRPVLPDLISKVERINGRMQFTYRDVDGNDQTVGSEMITYIPGPSLDGVSGHPLLSTARRIFSAAISSDRTAAQTLKRGIRIAGLVVPEEGEDVQPGEAEEILKSLRETVIGAENSGDIALINRRLKLQPWTPNNIDLQWAETRQGMLGEVGRLFGIPPHLLNDIEKQTSWGTGVSEQNLGLARFTLRGWSDRFEQTLSRRLPSGQFLEFDYKGLLQGTPADEIRLVIEQLDAGLIDLDYATRVLNLPAPSAAQRARAAAATAPPPGVTA